MSKPWLVKKFGPVVTSSEFKFRRGLERERLSFISNEPICTRNGCFNCDFIIDGVLVVEIAGDSHSGDTQERKDEWKTEELEEAGYSVLWFSDKEIKDHLDECIAKTKQALDEIWKGRRINITKRWLRRDNPNWLYKHPTITKHQHILANALRREGFKAKVGVKIQTERGNFEIDILVEDALPIEVDGHKRPHDPRDTQKQGFKDLELMNFFGLPNILHFQNDEIEDNLSNVVETIKQTLRRHDS